MKKLTAILFSAAIALSAAEPVLTVKLDEGTGTEIKTSIPEITGKLQREGHAKWIDGRSSGTKALAFDGVDLKRDQFSYVMIPINDKIDFTKPFSIAFWFKIAKNQKRNGQAEIVTTTRSDRGPGFRITFFYDMMTFRTGDGKTVFSASTNASKTPIERDVWNHCTVTFDGKAARLYLNGAQAAEVLDFPITKGNADLCIGSYGHGAAYGLTGAVSDLRIYDTVLTPKEILSIAKDMEE